MHKTLTYREWSHEAVIDFIQNYSFMHSWSNWLLELLLIALFIASVKIDVKQNKLSAMSFGFAALIGINLAAAATHGIEYTRSFRLLARDIAYINFTLLGFASLFFEFFVLQRVRLLKQHGFTNLERFPFKWITFFVLLFFSVFQLFNWFSRVQPKYFYAVLDYGASMLMMAAISIYILMASKDKNADGQNCNSDEIFDSRFETYTLMAILCFVIATFCLQSTFLTSYFPRRSDTIFHNVDLYHLLLLPGFMMLFKAKLHERKSIMRR